MDSRVFLAVDLGASSGRVIAGIFDGKTLELKEIKRFGNTPISIEGHLFWDINGLYSEIKAGFSVAIEEYGSRIVSVGICTWGVDYAFIGRGGNLLGKPFCYRDKRTKAIIQKVFEKISKEELYEITGLQTLEINTLYQLYSEILNNSSSLKSAEKLLFIPDLVTYWLTGLAVNEKTIASTSQMLDARTCKWSQPLLEKLGIRSDLFSEVVEPGTIIGPVKGVFDNCSTGVIKVVAVGSHDTASAVAATPIRSGTEAYLSSGTWSLMGAELDSPLINAKALEYNFTNEQGVLGTVRFLKNITGMWPLQECRNAWKENGIELSYDEITRLASEAPSFAAFVNVDCPIFSEPGNMPEKMVKYCRKTGQKPPGSKGSVIRTFLESLALKYKQVLGQLEELTGRSFEILHIVGGGCKNELLNQFIANALERIVAAGPVEATTAGNILMQLHANGDIGSIAQGRELVAQSFQQKIFTPADTQVWKEMYKQFLAIKDKLL